MGVPKLEGVEARKRISVPHWWQQQLANSNSVRLKMVSSSLIMQYAVCCSKQGTPDLSEQVSELLENGWSLYGNLVVFYHEKDIWFAQALTNPNTRNRIPAKEVNFFYPDERGKMVPMDLDESGNPVPKKE